MKTFKKSIALMLSAVMLFSTFSFVIANADDGSERPKVNIQVTSPVAGKSAEFTFKVDDKRFAPGIADYLLVGSDPVLLYEMCGRIPASSEECADALYRGTLNSSLSESPNDAKYNTAFYYAISQMMKGGITWIEYDPNEFQKLVDAGLAEQADELKDLPKFDYARKVLQSSAEYGYSFANVFGEGANGIASSARIMSPGDKFRAGKSYMCWCEATIDLKTEAKEMIDVLKTLEPYCKKALEIHKKIAASGEEESEELYAQLDALKAEYSKDLKKAENITEVARKKAADAGDGYPVITVNGEKAEENIKAFRAFIYDFGEAGKEASVLDRITEFFNSIIEFFRNLFSSIKF